MPPQQPFPLRSTSHPSCDDQLRSLTGIIGRRRLAALKSPPYVWLAISYSRRINITVRTVMPSNRYQTRPAHGESVQAWFSAALRCT